MILFTFTETENFARKADKILGGDGISELQSYLCMYPDDGSIIRASNGIRKIRWAASGRGKRGGARIIYYFAVGKERILLLDIYPKNEKSDLTNDELRGLKNVVSKWLEETG